MERSAGLFCAFRGQNIRLARARSGKLAVWFQYCSRSVESEMGRRGEGEIGDDVEVVPTYSILRTGLAGRGVPGFDRRSVKAALFRFFPFSPPFCVFAPVQVRRDQRRPFYFRFDGPSSRCRNSGAVFLVCRPAQLSSKRRRQPQLSGLQRAYTSAHQARQGLAPFMQKRPGEYEKIFETRRA